MNNIPNIALVGNAPKDKIDLLNSILAEEELTDLCDITLYGADGQPDDEALQDAVTDYHEGQVQAIVCLPLSKSADALLEEYTGEKPMPLYVNATGTMASVLNCTDIGDAAMNIHTEDVENTVTKVAKVLKRELDILNPRMALLSLNDNIAEGDTTEEETILTPAINNMVKKNIQVFGPYASSTFYDNDDYQAFDCVIQTYATQATEAMKAQTNNETVVLHSDINVTAVSAEPEGLLNAIFLAISVERNKKQYDQAFVNPLPKLYHERKEDGDKARFAVKKKGFNPAEHKRENVKFITEKKADAPAE